MKVVRNTVEGVRFTFTTNGYRGEPYTLKVDLNK